MKHSSLLLLSISANIIGALAQLQGDSELYAQVFLELHNKMRTDPTSFIPELEELVKSFDGLKRAVKIGTQDVEITTKEGATPVEGLIEFLRDQEPVQPLEIDPRINTYACSHVNDQGATSDTGHASTTGLSFVDRMKGLSKVNSIYGENLAYGTYEARDTLLTLAIDDGVASRGHRKNIFKPDFQRIGICEGPHNEYFQMVDVIYEGGIDSNGVYQQNYEAQQVLEAAEANRPPVTSNLGEGADCSMIGVVRPTCAPGYCCGAARAPGADIETQLELCQKEATISYTVKKDPIFNVATGYRSGDEVWAFTCIIGAHKLGAQAAALFSMAYMMM